MSRIAKEYCVGMDLVRHQQGPFLKNTEILNSLDSRAPPAFDLVGNDGV
jgi:hypothetical protein